jgi:hypothetical protein
MDTKTLDIICLNSIADIYIHFYKNEYKYYNVNIKSFNLSKLINLLLSIIRDIIILDYLWVISPMQYNC